MYPEMDKTNAKISVLGFVERQTVINAHPAPPCLYQYTDVQALHGIVGDHAIRATNIAYMNDAREFKAGLEVTVAALHAAIEYCGATSKPAMQSVLEKILPRFESAATSDYYAACFTSIPDQLSQWRGYGSDGSGYAIGFNLNDVLGPDKPAGDMELQLRKVIYVNSEQNSTASAPYKILVGCLDSIELTGNSAIRQSIMENADLIAGALGDRLENDIASYKDDGFSEEMEWRVLYHHKPEFRDDKVKSQRLKTRPRNGLLVPFVNINLRVAEEVIGRGSTSGRQVLYSIPRIVTGPRLDKAKAKFGIQCLFDSNWYGTTRLEIVPSSIPYLP